MSGEQNIIQFTLSPLSQISGKEVLDRQNKQVKHE